MNFEFMTIDIQTYIKSKPFADDAGNAINSI